MYKPQIYTYNTRLFYAENSYTTPRYIRCSKNLCQRFFYLSTPKALLYLDLILYLFPAQITSDLYSCNPYTVQQKTQGYQKFALIRYTSINFVRQCIERYLGLKWGGMMYIHLCWVRDAKIDIVSRGTTDRLSIPGCILYNMQRGDATIAYERIIKKQEKIQDHVQMPTSSS